MTVVFLGYHTASLLVAAVLKARGHTTVLVEIDEEVLHQVPSELRPLLRAIDHLMTVADWSDPTSLRHAITQRFGWPLSGVYTQLDEASPAAASLRLDLGLPTTPPDVVQELINKLKLRRKLRGLGRSKLRFLADDALDRLERWPFPRKRGFVKNAVGAGGYGVRGVKSLEELRSALTALENGQADTTSLTRLMQESRSRMLEEAAVGTFVSFEAMLVRGRCVPFGFTLPLRLEADIGDREPRPMPGCVHPYIFPHMDEVSSFLAETLVELDYTDGLVHIEAMIGDDGSCEIIDLNPRFIGAHCLWAFNAARTVPVEHVLADWAIGKAGQIPQATGGACLQYFLCPQGGGRLESLELPSDATVTWAARFKEVGTELAPNPVEGGWLGGYVVRATDELTAHEKAKVLRRSVIVNGKSNATF